MVFKVVFACAFAIMAQSIAGQTCYRPSSQSNCGGAGGISSGAVTPAISQSSCRPSISASAPIRSSGISGSISSNCVSIDIPQSGGPLVVTSVGPISPTGIAVATDLGLAGDLVLSGALPYLTAVAFEGSFPTESIVPVSYSCGDVVGITELIGGSGSTGSSVSGRSASAGVINTGYGSAVRPGCGCIY